jgi:uncharacterized protein
MPAGVVCTHSLLESHYRAGHGGSGTPRSRRTGTQLARKPSLVEYGRNKHMERVLISGASGLIGSALARSLEGTNADVRRLVRGTPRNADEITLNPAGGLTGTPVSGFDAVIHLAGETIVGRWTEAKKKNIRASRVEGTANLASALTTAEIKPKVFVCASAVGFYGDRGDEVLTERGAGGDGFLADVARDWESAARFASGAGIRTVNLRTGLVLSANGGALAKMLPPFRLGLGGRLGSGSQWWSWIHIDDVVGGIRHVMAATDLSGAVNFVSPNPVTNAEFTRELASTLHRPALFPVPAFALELAFGRMPAHELFLSSVRAVPEKLVNSGYSFRFPNLRGALENLV